MLDKITKQLSEPVRHHVQNCMLVEEPRFPSWGHALHVDAYAIEARAGYEHDVIIGGGIKSAASPFLTRRQIPKSPSDQSPSKDAKVARWSTR